jgi:ATP-dependent DNA helicase RecG
MTYAATIDDLSKLPCTHLKGVGAGIAEKLQQAGIYHIADLLFYLPYRYLDHTQTLPIAKLRHGTHAVIEGTLVSERLIYGKTRQWLLHLADPSGQIELRFLHYIDNYRKQLAPGMQLRCIGEARRWGTHLCMIHPQFQPLDTHQPLPCNLTPIYSAIAGLSQGSLTRIIDQALDLLSKGQGLPDYLPKAISEQYHFPSLTAALLYLHRPPTTANTDQLLAGTHPMQKRLAFEELLAHHLSLLRLRQQMTTQQSYACPPSQQLLARLLSILPFALTAAQQRVSAQVATDLSKASPCQRLIQGDVGCGKTIVAAMAAVQVIEQGHQVAFMAPTELLAEQHLQNFSRWFDQLDIEIALLLSRHSASRRQQSLTAIREGKAKMVIGTHALFQDAVEFNQLALVIIDEQHRFGVQQRLALREKGKQNNLSPHQLIMTATPIPRTLAMSVYADLDHSIIDELPPGRKPITTLVLPNSRRADIVDRIATVCQRGEQVYWLCTLIEESETLQCETAEATWEQLQKALPQFRLGLVHGRLKPQQKSEQMLLFQQGAIDILIATTVIEVGVDVANASLMIIENAERLGLAQLHQLRGRVGRGSQASFCVLLYQAPLSHNAQKRLAVMRRTQDGFEIANTDLEIRGPGEVLGTRQAGMVQLKMASLIRDQALLPLIQQTAVYISQQQPKAIVPLIARWIGQAENYVHA